MYEKYIENADGTKTLVVQLSGSNVEETNGANIATKSNLVAGESPTGKQRPLNVDEDGKLQVGVTIDSLTVTTVGIDQTTDGDTNRVVAKISQEAGENVVKATDLETLVTALNGKVDTLLTSGISLSGSKMELYGVASEDRPDANTVAVGTTFTIVDNTGNYDSYISDGINWLEV